MTPEEQDLILHTLKSIDESQKRHDKHKEGVLDMMFKELNVHIPERRENGDRREVALKQKVDHHKTDTGAMM